jgi:hypothetical protein
LIVARVYDLVMTHQLDADGFFIHCIQRLCAAKGMDFFLVEPVWIKAFLEAYQRDEVWARALLNMHSEHHLPDDPFHRLVELADARKTIVIDPPRIAQSAFDKSQLHPRLVEAGIHVPPSIIINATTARDLQLTAEQKDLLGDPFVIKPARGYGRRGVVLDAHDEKDMVRSMIGWPDQNYLLQRKIAPRDLEGRPAYWRVFFVFGSLWWCWWNCFTDRYTEVLPEEIEQFGLKPIGLGMQRIASLTGMNFFSSEIAQTVEGDFVWIDYVNDQCHMLTQSANPRMGVPDRVVEGIANRLVEAAVELIRRPSALAA